jgi:hypothetical protein
MGKYYSEFFHALWYSTVSCFTKLAETKIINKRSEREKKWERNSDIIIGRGRQMQRCTHEEMTLGTKWRE